MSPFRHGQSRPHQDLLQWPAKASTMTIMSIRSAPILSLRLQGTSCFGHLDCYGSGLYSQTFMCTEQPEQCLIYGRNCNAVDSNAVNSNAENKVLVPGRSDIVPLFTFLQVWHKKLSLSKFLDWDLWSSRLPCS